MGSDTSGAERLSLARRRSPVSRGRSIRGNSEVPSQCGQGGEAQCQCSTGLVSAMLRSSTWVGCRFINPQSVNWLFVLRRPKSASQIFD
jgi:hypothetical protein